jgi:indolepyruvate ferredoxin oxidoreductase beta subunit
LKANNIIVSGVGGQGSILVSHIIAETVIKRGRRNVRVGETYGGAMRGGSVVSHVRLYHAFSPLISEDKAEVLIALEPLEGFRIAVKYLSPEGVAFISDSKILPIDVKMGCVEYPSLEDISDCVLTLAKAIHIIPAKKLAIQAGNEKSLNIVMLGVVAASNLLDMNEEDLLGTVISRVPSDLVEVNKRAFKYGYDYFKNKK